MDLLNVPLTRGDKCLKNLDLLNQFTKVNRDSKVQLGINKKNNKKNDHNEKDLDTFESEIDRNNLEIILWNKEKTIKLLHFFTNTNEMAVNQTSKLYLKANKENRNLNFQKPKEEINEIGKIGIRILPKENEEFQYKFKFETLNSSKIREFRNKFDQEFKWKGGKNNITFQINLKNNLTKLNYDHRFLSSTQNGNFFIFFNFLFSQVFILFQTILNQNKNKTSMINVLFLMDILC